MHSKTFSLPKRKGFPKGKITVFHNGDFSGEIRFVLSNVLKDNEDIQNGDFEVPFDILKSLVFSHLRQEEIRRLEDEEDNILTTFKNNFQEGKKYKKYSD